MSSVEVIRVKDVPLLTLGEGPHWDEDSNSLLFVDIRNAFFYRYYPATGRNQRLTLEPSSRRKTVTFIIPVDGHPDLFLVSHDRSIGLVKWLSSDPDDHTTKLYVLDTVDEDKPLNRFNDGKCDPQGRFWAGTMGYEAAPLNLLKKQGKLFRFSSEVKQSTVLEQVNLSNGLAWSNDGRSFYYIDTLTLSVDAFDYDEATGNISNRRQLVDYKAEGLVDNYPDGMTIDVDGNLWVANYNGAKIICIDPTKSSIIRTINIPVQNPTSMCWGGSDYSTLYLTSSHYGFTEKQLKEGPDNGGVIKITGLGTKGKAASKVKISEVLIKSLGIE